MNALPKRVAVVRQRVQKAENDLVAAEQILRLEEGCPFDTVCFHAQQCVEKYLKSLLTLRGTRFPKSHDLNELVRLLPSEPRLEFDAAEIEQLSSYAVEPRYPGGLESLTRQDAVQAVAVARRVRQAIRACLPPEGMISTD